jgi:predicted AlkP superfamily pyrophosphatase or phosphodiesterase
VKRRPTLLAALVAVIAAASLEGSTRRIPATDIEQTAPGTPKLLVIVVVDQMRFDYLDRFAALWTGGFKRFMTEGAVFERGFYPYLNTVTCAGHATIGTGAFPYTHGIIMNEWYQRAAHRRMSCTDDPSITSLPYTGTPEPIGHSAHRLRVPTLGDRLRTMSRDARVVTLSMKPRSTVMLAGHGGTAVTWFGDTNTWATSTAFTPALLPAVKMFVDANPVDRDRGVLWDRSRPAAEYQQQDASAFERARSGWNATFPHPLAGAPGAPATQFFDLWERSPYADDYVGRLAAHLVRAYELGRRDTPDYLGVSFSGLDYVGHDFGPDSQEVQDTLVRLDTTLGALFTMLDETVGRGRWAAGLSADHGVARIPEAMKAEGIDAGRVINAEVQKAAEAAMVAAHGPGPHVALVEYTNLYLSDAARERMSKDPTYVQPIVDAVGRIPGVLRVFPSRGLETRRNSSDPIERAAAISYHPEESGEITVVLKPNWIGTNSSTTTHGSAQPYDQHVPVLFLGGAFKAGRYSDSASPADLAPTLASLARISMPEANGHVLNAAVRH